MCRLWRDLILDSVMFSRRVSSLLLRSVKSLRGRGRCMAMWLCADVKHAPLRADAFSKSFRNRHRVVKRWCECSRMNIQTELEFERRNTGMVTAESGLGSNTVSESPTDRKISAVNAVPPQRPTPIAWLKLTLVVILIAPFLAGSVILLYAIACVLVRWQFN